MILTFHFMHVVSRHERGEKEGSSHQPSLDGLAAVITWSKAGMLRSVLLQEGKRLQSKAQGGAALMIKASAVSTISLQLTSSNQYQLVVHTGLAAVMVELSLPWSGDSKEVNVWDSGHSCTKLQSFSCAAAPNTNLIRE
jgi:hypothetical protein